MIFDDIRQIVIENRDIIPILDSVAITDLTWGRLDLLVLKYYSNLLQASPEDTMFDYYSLLLDYNQIVNVTDIKIGQVIDIPDLLEVINNLKENSSQKVPGLNPLNPSETNSPVTQQVKNIVHGIPKLKTHTQEKIKYDEASGKVVF